jgi:hypothetical protein
MERKPIAIAAAVKWPPVLRLPISAVRSAAVQQATSALSVYGRQLDRKTIPLMATFFATFDVGVDTCTPVNESYELPFRFTGTIDKLTVKVGPTQLSESEQ